MPKRKTHCSQGCSDDDDDEYEDKDDEPYVHVPKSWKQDEDSGEEDDEDEDEDDEAYMEEGEEEGEEEDADEEPPDELPDPRKFKITKLSVTLTRKGKEGSLGFALAEIGNHVTMVHKGGLAAKAGIQVGDKITEVNGKDCGMESFASLLPKDKAQPIKLRLARPVAVDE